jgi:hypothetical protein
LALLTEKVVGTFDGTFDGSQTAQHLSRAQDLQSSTNAFMLCNGARQ